jgi:hypothetical protein
MEFLINILIGISGILVYNLWAFRQHLKTPKTLATNVFWEAYLLESKFIWIWAILFLFIVSGIVSYQPELGAAITQLTGLDITNNIGAYFTFGLGVSSLSDTKKK